VRSNLSYFTYVTLRWNLSLELHVRIYVKEVLVRISVYASVQLFFFLFVQYHNSASVMEYVRFVRDFAVSITRAFVGTIFFFWPRRYKDIQEDVVLVTGGGKGIGRLIAMEFAKRQPKQVGCMSCQPILWRLV